MNNLQPVFRSIVPHVLPQVNRVVELIGPELSQAAAKRKFKTTHPELFDELEYHLNKITEIEKLIGFMQMNNLPFKVGTRLKIFGSTYAIAEFEYEPNFSTNQLVLTIYWQSARS